MALNVGTLYATLDLDSAHANASLASFNSSMKKAGEKISGMGDKLVKGLTLPIAGAAIGFVKMASDYNENLNKVNVAFGKNAGQVSTWASNATKNFGLSGNAALEMTSLFGDMATGMGINTGSAATMSTSMAGLAADLSSYKNISVEQAQSALAGVFTGEGDSLKQLGIIMTEGSLEAFALSTHQKKLWKNMTDGEKATVRLAFVMSKTKNATGDYARTSGGTANQIRGFQAAISNLSVAFGSILLPVITPIIAKATELANKFTKLSPAMQKNILIIMAIAAAIGPVLIVIGSLITMAGTLGTVIAGLGAAMAFILSPIGLIIIGIVALVAVFVYLYKTNKRFASSVVALWTDIKSTITVILAQLKIVFTVFVAVVHQIWAKYGSALLTIAVVAFNLIASVIRTALNIIKNVITIFTGIVSGNWSKVWEGIKGLVVTTWKGIWDVISIGLKLIIKVITLYLNMYRDVFNRIWNGIKSATAAAFNAIKLAVTTKLTALKAALTIALNAVKLVFTNAWTAVKLAVVNAFNAVKTSITTRITNTKTSITTILNNIKTAFTNAWTSIKAAAVNAFNTFKTSITTRVTNTKTAIGTTITSLKTALATAWTAIKNAATTGFNKIKAAMTAPITAAKTAISGIITTIKGFFTNLILKIPSIKLPTMPRIKITGSFSINPPSVPHFTWYGKGGIVDSPTFAGLGERGLEAVVPLTGSAADTFASAFLTRLQGVGGGSLSMAGGITINIRGDVKDPATFAKLISREINKETNKKTRVRGY